MQQKHVELKYNNSSFGWPRLEAVDLNERWKESAFNTCANWKRDQILC